MGVKGLQTYVDACPGASSKVNLRILAVDYRKKYQKQPTLVIDGFGFIRKLYPPNLDWIYGGQWVQFQSNVTNLVGNFKAADINPVFIFDGVVEKKKRATWIQRRKSDRRLVANIFRYIQEKRRHPGQNMYFIPTGVTGFCRRALKAAGVTVYKSTVEADKEIYQYYHDNNCFGVLGQDSDYFIYNIDHYFCLKDFDIRTLDVSLYNKDIICQHLSLELHQLPLLACLLGNDIISLDILQPFHEKLFNMNLNNIFPPAKVRVAIVAEFIHNLGVQELSEEYLSHLECDLLGSNRHLFTTVVEEYTLDSFTKSPIESAEELQNEEARSETGMNNYPVDGELKRSMEININPEVYEQIKSGNRSLLKLIKFAELDQSTSLEDDEDNSMPSSGLLFRPIRRRIYGIVLNKNDGRNEENNESLTSRHVVGVNAIAEWVVYAGFPLIEEDIVPMVIPCDSLTLDDLWLNSHDEMQEIRLKAFLFCAHCEICVESVSSIPEQYIVLCLLLHYMIKSKDWQITGYDVDALISQTVCLRTHDEHSLSDMMVANVNGRAVHLATLVMRGISSLELANSTCNAPIKNDAFHPWRFFDGKLFHKKYMMAEAGAPVNILCNQMVEHMELFEKLKSFIVKGTSMEHMHDQKKMLAESLPETLDDTDGVWTSEKSRYVARNVQDWVMDKNCHSSVVHGKHSVPSYWKQDPQNSEQLTNNSSYQSRQSNAPWRSYDNTGGSSSRRNHGSRLGDQTYQRDQKTGAWGKPDSGGWRNPHHSAWQSSSCDAQSWRSSDQRQRSCDDAQSWRSSDQQQRICDDAQSWRSSDQRQRSCDDAQSWRSSDQRQRSCDDAQSWRSSDQRQKSCDDAQSWRSSDQRQRICDDAQSWRSSDQRQRSCDDAQSWRSSDQQQRSHVRQHEGARKKNCWQEKKPK